jgi:hypothetical protein
VYIIAPAETITMNIVAARAGKSAKDFDPAVYGCYCRKCNDDDDLYSLIPSACALWFVGYSITTDVCIKIA